MSIATLTTAALILKLADGHSIGLAYVLAGREGYEVTDGAILYLGRNLLELAPEERAREGIFLAFQYPVEIPGVTNNYFLRAAVNAVRRLRSVSALTR